MTSSPFHGIFSSKRNQDKPDDDAESSVFEHVFDDASSKAATQVGKVAVDIYEQDDYYIIKAPIAGVHMNDLDIEVDGNVLTIRGTRTQGDQVPKHQYYLQECYWGPFSRKVTLPIQIDPRKVRATFNKDCVLKILIPKEEKVKIIRVQEG